jgi:hypothetical protein
LFCLSGKICGSFQERIPFSLLLHGVFPGWDRVDPWDHYCHGLASKPSSALTMSKLPRRIA